MVVMRLSAAVRKLWAEKLLDLAHIAAGALIFGQFLSDRTYSISIALYGLLVLLVGYLMSLLLLRKL